MLEKEFHTMEVQHTQFLYYKYLFKYRFVNIYNACEKLSKRGTLNLFLCICILQFNQITIQTIFQPNMNFKKNVEYFIY